MTRRLPATGVRLRAALAIGAVLMSSLTATLAPMPAQAAPASAPRASLDSVADRAASGILPMRFATGGAGQYQGAIDWFEWGTQGQVLPAAGMTRTETREVPGGTLATTCTVGAPSGGQVVVQRPGTYTGDGLDDLYNVGGTGADNQLAIGLGNFGTPDVSFSFNCSVTLNGAAVPLAGLVMADAEASLQPSEWLQATIPAGANWRMIDRFRSSDCTENGTVIRSGQTLRFAGIETACATFPTGVAFMEGASSASVALHSGSATAIGRTAVALGVVLFSDFGDAPASYGDAGSLYSPNFTGPAVAQGTSTLFGPALSTTGQPAVRLGAAVTPEQGSQPGPAAGRDSADDGVRFNTDVSVPGRNETVWVEASAAGFLNAWIDFDRNGTFDEGERIADDTPVVAGTNQITYVVPEGDDFVPGASFARFRVSAGAGEVTGPTGVATNGEVEDYARELFDAQGEALGLCVAGTEPVPVSLIQNPSFEDRTGNFTNSGASTIAYAEHWTDSHPTGGQYHVYSPEFDSGPAAATQPVRAGADGFAFEGGHSTGGTGEGAVGVLTAALDPDATYVGFFSMANGGYTREGDGYMQFLGTNDLRAGSIPNGAVTPQTPANTELLYSTPVVDHAGNGVRPTWELNTFQLDASQAWPYLRVEVRNEIPANDATVAGQVWMNFDDFHMYECEPIQDFGDAPAGYGTRLEDDGPRHLLAGYDADATTAPLMLGSLVDEEEDGFLGDAARGDDEGAAADEDGVADPIVVSPREASTVTVTATNDTDAAATLSGWVDLDGNGAFDATELVTVPVPANSGSAPYAVTFPAATTTDETFARFRLFAGDVTTFLPTGAAVGGEVEDYAVSVLDQELTIEKSSTFTADSRPGDTVTYTVTATNTGTDAYTADDPAVVFDDLAAVVDDGEYNGDAEAVASDGSTIPAPTFITPNHVSWAGPLAAGESVEVTYTVTLAGGGDGVVRNIAWQPNTPFVPGGPPPATPLCDPADEDGTDPVTGEACAAVAGELPRLSVTKTSDVTDLPVDGGEVTYTVTVTNEGPGAYTEGAPAVVTDDLGEVLDDAEFGEIVAPAEGAVFDADAQTLVWSGALEAGESATITYTVTYDSSTGDNVLYNLVCVPADQVVPGAENCADVRIPGAELEVTKSVDPADGTAVQAGQTLTYTLSFASNGETAAAVDKVDVLSDVLDDAALVDGSITVSDAGLTAILDGTDLVITGSVPAGRVTTVTYSVVVDAYADQENHILANVVQNPDGSCDVEGCPETSNRIRHFSVTKSASPTDGVMPGDTIEYTVTVTNDGAADYTMSAQAGVTDDLADVLDDATYNGDVAAVASDGSVVPAPTFGTPVLAWSGPVAVGESVEITYSVTVTNQGDADLENTATPECAPGVICDPPTPPVEIVMPRVTPAKASDPASGTDVAAGQVITYTLSFTNDGQATGAIDTTDDLSGILDDAEITTAPATSVESVTAVYDAEAHTIRVEGDLAAGASVSVTYRVTIRPDGERGDNIVTNVLSPDVPPYVCAQGDAACQPFVPPTTEHRIGELDDWKTVDPAAGATVRPGQVMTYTLHFENTGEAPVAVNRDDVLTHVLDDAAVTAEPVASEAALLVSDIAKGRFSIAGALEPGQLVTVTYEVTVNADGARGDDRLGNFLVDAGEQPPAECVPDDDARADCTVNSVSNVVVTKSANPASGADVAEGQRVTYTLTFQNVSTNPDAADVDVDYTDHMAGVLDDATLVGQPTVSVDGVTATVAGTSIRVVGPVSSGETVTVSYAVAVKTWADQGDHRLGNVVAITGEEPVCAADSPLCTVHDAIEPDPLAATGGDIAWAAVIGGVLLLLVGGGTLLIARLRRDKRESA